MNSIKTYTLRIEGDSPEQAVPLAVNGIKFMLEKVKSENRLIEKYILAFHFNHRDAVMTDSIKKCYMGLIDVFEGIIGWEAQEVILTASTDNESDMRTTYTIDVIFYIV